MSIFTTIGNDKRSERKALAASVLVSLAFLSSFVSLSKPVPPEPPSVIVPRPVLEPVPPVKLEETKALADPNEEYRIVPPNFQHIDFYNWSYGRYKFWGQKLNLVLTQGKQEYSSEKGGGGETFSLKDVYYKDIAGDGRPEALVILSHVQCGGSCDGGSYLLYVYANSKRGIKKIWEYETGSMAYGCGLKGLTLSNKEIVLEMFGRCFQPATEVEVAGKFMIADTTYSLFTFNGSRFVKRQTEIISEPVRDVKNHNASIQIFDL